MIVVAVDVSFSIADDLDKYNRQIKKVISSLSFPIRYIRWSHKVTRNEIVETYNPAKFHLDYSSAFGLTQPQCFLKILPRNEPIDLYVFTDGRIMNDDIAECKKYLEDKTLLISQVHLFYIKLEENEMNTGFVDIFKNNECEFHLDEKYIGKIEKKIINFDSINYDYIMKDDSFKLSILNEINSGTDQAYLKKQIHNLETRILRDYFKDKLSISKFYNNKDVQGCIEYVRNHCYFSEKANFQRRIANVLQLFDKNIDKHSMDHFKDVPEYTLKNDDDNITTIMYDEEEELEECKPLECDILGIQCKIRCIPVKECFDNVCLDKKTWDNPLKILDSDKQIQRFVSMVEPYTMDYQATYKNLTNPNISPFSRDKLKGVYLLHTDGINTKDLIRHNNYVLSTFFQNKLPGKAIVWHVVFLYILAMRRFPEAKEILFREIRFLGEHSNYFISLNPLLNPPIVENLNCCFWYIANVCPKAFPNSKKNVLRNDYVSGKFLEFYKNVYEDNYEWPLEMNSWQLWYNLWMNKLDIFKILSYFFDHEELNPSDRSNSSDSTKAKHSFEIILYQKEKKSKIPEEFNFLTQMDLKTILNINSEFEYTPGSYYYKDLSSVKNYPIELYKDSNVPSLLHHIQINPKTCHPYLICPTTGKYWRDCIGPYDQERGSYLRLFNRYCKTYLKYPENAHDLCIFFNEYIYKKKNFIPELFEKSLKDEMNLVMKIFEEIMKLYSCEIYIQIANAMSSENIRYHYEKTDEDKKKYLKIMKKNQCVTTKTLKDICKMVETLLINTNY